MFGQAAAVLVSLAAGLALELAVARLFLHQSGALACTTAATFGEFVGSSQDVGTDTDTDTASFGRTGIGRGILREAAGWRGIARDVQGAESWLGRHAPPAPRAIDFAIGSDVDGSGDGSGAGCCVDGGALSPRNAVRGVVRG